MVRIYFIVALFCFFILSALPASAQQSDNYRSNLYDTEVTVDGGGLPIVFINTNKKKILRNGYIIARMKIINNEDDVNYSDTINHPDQKVDYEGWIELKYRGNTSFSSSEKKPYALHTLKSDTLSANGGKKDKVKILGMGKDNKWVMLAPWSDRSMIRDALAFNLGRPWFDFTPETRFCEVILDGTYFGVYIFTEKVSQGKHRLDLNDPGSDDGDFTGDYLVKIDRSDSPYHQSKHKPWKNLKGGIHNSYIKYQYDFPDDEDFENIPGARDSLNNEIDRMEDVFAANDYQDSVNGYRKYIDVNSFIDYMLTTELAMNIDGYRLSTYMYKYSNTHARNEGLDPRWKMTLWDFNIAFGNADYYHGDSTNYWQYLFNNRESGETEAVPFYWYKMLNDPWYMQQMKKRWTAYRHSNYSDEAIIAEIDSLSNRLSSSGACQRNEQAWAVFDRWSIWPCPYNDVYDYDSEIAYTKDWIADRLKFMDKSLLLEDEPENIKITEIGEWKMENSPCYNLSGHKVGNDYRGIVISNCRKEIMAR